MRHLVSALFVVLATACSSERPLAAPAGASAAPTASASDPRIAVSQDLIKKGWRPVMRGDQMYYCRTDVLTGTHFPTKVCLTEDRIQGIEKSAHDQLEDLNRRNGCLGPECN